MPVLDTVSRLAELSAGVARNAGSVALSIVRTLAARVLGHRPGSDAASGWTRRWEPSSSRPVGEPPPPPSEPRRPAATAPAPRTRAPSPVPPPAPAPAMQAPAPAPVSQPAPAPAPAAPQAPAPPEPAHVDSGAVVVAEFADAGAADGAGAEVHVDEPWEGYSRLTARDVTAQLATADPATLAVVRLYESSHRKRRTVLAAVDRRLATPGG